MNNHKGLIGFCLILLFAMSQSFAQKIEKIDKNEHWIYDHDTTLYGADSNLFVVQNLGKNVNSDHVESGPRISPDGKTLYYFRIEPTKIHIGGKDTVHFKRTIYKSTWKPSDSTWTKAVKESKPLNNLGDNSVHSISPDGKTLLLHNIYLKNDLTDNGVSISRKIGKSWSFPEPQKIKKYKNDQVCSFYMSDDQKFLILAIHNPDSFGEQDLYVSFNDGKDHWSEPLNLGPKINSKMTEATAFLASDNTTLYFSTNAPRAGSFGGFDIYKTTRLDSTWMKWSTPENIGLPYNTPDDEFYFSHPENMDYSYLAHHFKTSDGQEHSDIVRVKMKEEWKPRWLILTGRLWDENTKERIPGKVELKYDKWDTTLVVIDSMDEFHDTLKLGRIYDYVATSPTYDSVFSKINLSEVTKFKIDTIDIYLKHTPIRTLKIKVINRITGLEIPALVTVKELPNTPLMTKEHLPGQPAIVKMPGGKTYLVSVTSEDTTNNSGGYFPQDLPKIDLTNLKMDDEDSITVELDPLHGLVLDLENVEFETGSADLKPESFAILDELIVQVSKIKVAIKVQIQGHTDNVGSDSNNLILSKKRAASVVKYITENGLKPEMFTSEGFGESKPRATNDTPEGRQRNRRVEFHVLN